MEHFYSDKPMRLDVKCFVDFLCWYYKDEQRFKHLRFGQAFYQFMEFDKYMFDENNFEKLYHMSSEKAKKFVQENFEFV